MKQFFEILFLELRFFLQNCLRESRVYFSKYYHYLFYLGFCYYTSGNGKYINQDYVDKVMKNDK